MPPKTPATTEPESAFNELADKLERQAEYLSFTSQKANHLAHQRITETGRDVIPLILRRIERGGGLWYRALEIITGAPSPSGVTPAEGGYTVDERAVNAAWLQWGREQGYRW